MKDRNIIASRSNIARDCLLAAQEIQEIDDAEIIIAIQWRIIKIRELIKARSVDPLDNFTVDFVLKKD